MEVRRADLITDIRPQLWWALHGHFLTLDIEECTTNEPNRQMQMLLIDEEANDIHTKSEIDQTPCSVCFGCFVGLIYKYHRLMIDSYMIMYVSFAVQLSADP